MIEKSASPTAIDSTPTRPRRILPRRIWIVGLGILAVAAIVADGAWQKPADPVEPLVLQGENRVGTLDSAALRIATFNIHAGVGRDGIRDLDRTAAALPNLDVVALQEVRNPVFGFNGPQVAAVADQLHMAWLFVPAERRWWRNDYGNALLTRAALTDCVRIPLPTPARHRFRAALLANFVHQGRTVHLLAAHIDKDLEQNTHDLQLRTVADLFLSLSEPAILMGDLNEFSTHPEIVRLLRTAGVHSALADVPKPKVKTDPIDWIFTRGFRTVRAEWRVTPSSDHPVACAELQFSEPTVSNSKPITHTAALSLDR
jgi:endonuclease/exonuclease/phosphatase family metal-dependent hydrolase